ncbi:MAG: phosphoribosylamine--glycine ligase [bacterium]
MVKIFLLGNGAREHVIAETLKRSSQDVKLFSYIKSRNPGIVELSEDVCVGSYTDYEKIKDFAKKSQVDFAFIGPDDPIGDGIVDVLEEIGIKSVAPKKTVARLESSKSFTRELLTKYSIPGNPKYKIFTKVDSETSMKEFLDSIVGFVIKPDGLTGGKGVKVQGDHLETINDAVKYCKEVLETHPRVVIEEKLEGQEFSLMCLTDGETVLKMPCVQDHKRAYVNDEGPNTGGMGSYSDADHSLPFLSDSDVEDAYKITKMVAKALEAETGVKFKGVMYGGWICTSEGIRLIEFNARFGDPEVMNVLPILKTDFVKVCQAIIDEKLDEIGELEFEKKATVCKYVVPKGYPTNPSVGEKIEIGQVSDNVKMYYASVDKKDDGLYLSTSRAIGFVGISDDIYEAEKVVQEAVGSVKGPVFFRPDIGTKELIQKRVEHMIRVRPE